MLLVAQSSIAEEMRREDTVKLISAEGFEFVIDKKAAMVSQTIRNMLTSPGTLFIINEEVSKSSNCRGRNRVFIKIGNIVYYDL